MQIEYKVNAPVTAEQFVELLIQSTLSERRPVDDLECMEGMIKNSNLHVTSWANGKLVGIARSITDYHYACYLSDLAVHLDYQHKGIGLELQKITQQQLGPRCKLIVIAAPNANAYYPHIGFTHHSGCWILARDHRLTERKQ